MNREEIIVTLRGHERELRKRGVRHIALFGSVARNDAKPESDIDILIELEPHVPVGVFEYVGIAQYLADPFRTVWTLRIAAVSRLSCGPTLNEMPFTPSKHAPSRQERNIGD